MGLIQSIGNDVTFARAALRSLKKVNAIYADETRTFADVIEDFARTKTKQYRHCLRSGYDDLCGA